MALMSTEANAYAEKGHLSSGVLNNQFHFKSQINIIFEMSKEPLNMNRTSLASRKMRKKVVHHNVKLLMISNGDLTCMEN